VPLSSCPSRGTEIERFQALRDPKQPLESLTPPERSFALTEICERIKTSLFKLRQSLIPADDSSALQPEPPISREDSQGIAANVLPRSVNRDSGRIDLEYQMLFGALAVQMELISPVQ
jgi:hypothetical protein